MFNKSGDEETKEKVADALVRLGDEKTEYWTFLVRQATPAAESDAPYPMRDNDRSGPSTAFADWAKSHGLSTDVALQRNLQEAKAVLFLAETGDVRGIPVLQKVMQTNNPLAVSFAAKGLALDRDEASVPLLLATAKRIPSASEQIAEALVYFDDPLSQDAVNSYLASDSAKSLRVSRAQGVDPFGR